MTTYDCWRSSSLQSRASYVAEPEPLLFSILTPVRNTPPDFLRALAKSILTQDFGTTGVFEWVIVDNGSTTPATLDILEDLHSNTIVHLVRSEDNLGIIRGTRLAARHARGRYLIPVDHDDYLYPDAIRIAACFVQQHRYPAFLYSDEDKLDGNIFCDPYLKPDWDPVLFAHSCYTSHAGIIDRALAEMLGLYTDLATEGSPDWDAFFRLMIAGYRPVHIPEVLYSWRKHAESTSTNIRSKSYIDSSQRAVLERFRLAQPGAPHYAVEYSPLFNETPDWCFRRSRTKPRPFATIVIGGPTSECRNGIECEETGTETYSTHYVSRDMPVTALREIVRDVRKAANLVRLIGWDVTMDHAEWYWDAIALTELFPDTVAVGGPLYNPDGICLSAGMHFGFGNGCCMPRLLRRDTILGTSSVCGSPTA